MRTVRKHTHTHTCRYLSATVACGTTKLPRSCWVASGWANVMWGNWISFLPNLPWSCPEGWPLRQRASFSALALIFCFDPYFSTFDVLCLLFVSLVSCFFPSEHQNHARELVKKADLSQCDALVIMSGDGLLFEVSDWTHFSVVSQWYENMCRGFKVPR